MATLSNEQIAQLCEQARPRDNSPIHFHHQLLLLIRYYLTVTLDALRESPPETTTAHVTQYIEWMRRQLGRFNHDEHLFLQSRWPELLESVEYRTTLEEATESSNSVGKFCVAIGRSLFPLIKGTTNLEVFMPGGELFNAYFNEQFSSQHLLKPFEVFLSNLAHKNPLMKILEIGANGGNANLPCANILSADGYPQWLRYDYTDISTDLLIKAEEKLNTFGNRFHFQVFDPEIGPAAQGFEEFSYDLVIATHVSIS